MDRNDRKILELVARCMVPPIKNCRIHLDENDQIIRPKPPPIHKPDPPLTLEEVEKVKTWLKLYGRNPP